MKKYFSLFILILIGLFIGLINSCKKDVASPPPTDTGSFTEEFEKVYTLWQKGWVIASPAGDSVFPALWDQGRIGGDKTGAQYGFAAFSYSANQDEFVYSYVLSTDSNYSVNSWLITPVLSVKNGDKISFYVRGDTAEDFTDRLQVLMNLSTSIITGDNIHSVGDFKKILFDINADQIPGGFPINWTKYEYSFSGFTEKTKIRIAFRHFLENASHTRGVGIDLFRFQVQ